MRVTDEVSVVAAMVASSHGVAQVSVTLNGAKVFQQSERTPQKSVAVAASVKLREGVNAIVLSANEPDGTLRQELRTVIYERPKGVEAVPVVPPPVARERWAVVIGVGQYENAEIPGLRYAVPDAEAIAEVLTGAAGFKKEHVLMLTDKTAKPPSLRNIKWALGTFLARSAGKEDTVLIFYAGHGAPEVDPRRIEGDGLAKYLVPRDADPDDLFSTALPMDDLQISPESRTIRRRHGRRRCQKVLTRRPGVQNFRVPSKIDEARLNEQIAEAVAGIKAYVVAVLRGDIRQCERGADERAAAHLLLGHIYDRMGLKELAAGAFEEARLLSTRRS